MAYVVTTDDIKKEEEKQKKIIEEEGGQKPAPPPTAPPTFNLILAPGETALFRVAEYLQDGKPSIYDPNYQGSDKRTEGPITVSLSTDSLSGSIQFPMWGTLTGTFTPYGNMQDIYIGSLFQQNGQPVANTPFLIKNTEAALIYRGGNTIVNDGSEAVLNPTRGIWVRLTKM